MNVFVFSLAVTTGPRVTQGPPETPSTAGKVAFSVRLGNKFPKGDKPIAFKDVIYNGQNSYNTKTGYFTCKTPGVYEFSFYASVNGNDASLDLFHNRKRILHAFTTKQKGFITASGNVNVKLKKKDRVFLVARSGHNGLTEDSMFSGHLLFTE